MLCIRGIMLFQAIKVKTQLRFQTVSLKSMLQGRSVQTYVL